MFLDLLPMLVVCVLVWLAVRVVMKPDKDDAPTSGVRITISYGDDSNDNWEGSFWDVAESRSVSAQLRIAYTDGKGNDTTRSIRVRQFGECADHVLIMSHCLLRDSTRTFRSDRIRECIDEETGEVVIDVAAYLRHKYETSPDRSLDRLAADEIDTLRVLLYVGKADGQLKAAEKAIIRETCLQIAGDTRLTDDAIDRLFKELRQPSVHAFKIAVGRIAKQGEQKGAVLLSAAERMVATQKTVHAAETEALEYMRTRFGTDAPGASASS